MPARATAIRSLSWNASFISAMQQYLTYNEFLPALLGPENAPDAADAAYSEDVNASITNSFATAIFRFGHSRCLLRCGL